MRNKKRNRMMLLVILLLAISIGFAALATTLKINGTANVSGNTWSVYWANVGDYDMSETTTVTTGARVKQGDTTTVEFAVNLNQPGDYYEFQVDAVNAGTLDAMVGLVSEIIDDNGSTSLPSYVSLDVTYADGGEVHQYDLLPKATVSGNSSTPSTERYKVRVEFSREIDEDDLAEIGNGKSISMLVNIPYDQADSHAVNRAGLIDSCVGCQFAHLEYKKYYSDDNEDHEERSTIVGNEDDLTRDFTTIKTEYNEQSRAFNGFTVDANNKITRGFVCGVYNDKAFCIEGSTDGSTYNHNKEILLEIFGNFSSETYEGCQMNESETGLLCSGNTVLDGGNETGFINAEAYDDGGVEVADDFYRCMAHYEGDMYCE